MPILRSLRHAWPCQSQRSAVALLLLLTTGTAWLAVDDVTAAIGRVPHNGVEIVGPAWELPGDVLRFQAELEAEGNAATVDWIEEQCEKDSVDTLPTNHYDAFGHCWFGCEAERYCWVPFCSVLVGGMREGYREYIDSAPHDSYQQDLNNQRTGHDLYWFGGEGSCYGRCADAYEAGQLDLSAPEREWRDCETGERTDEPPEDARCEHCSLSHGDPHLLTADGFEYDFQAAGELVAVQSLDGDLVIQVRQQPWRDSQEVSINVAVAARVAGDRVGAYATADGLQVKVDGVARPNQDERMTLPHGGRLTRAGDRVTLRWPDGSQLRVERFGDFLDVQVGLAATRSGRVRGLFGNANGNPGDDLATRDGRPVRLPDSPGEARRGQLYDLFGDSWRIRQAESLFDYRPGESTATFQLRSFPASDAQVGNLPPAARERARQVCKEADITASAFLDDCMLDVGITRDAAFARSARGAARAHARESRAPRASDLDEKTVELAITRPGVYPLETFTAKQGETMFFRAAATGTLRESVLEVVAPQGETVFENCLGCATQPGEQTLPQTGTYRARITTYGDETGTLRVTRNRVPAPQEFGLTLPAEIAPDVPGRGAGRIEVPGGRDVYRFAARAGETLFLGVTMKDESLYLSQWQLRDPAGNLLLDDLDITPTVVPLPASGTYTLVVVGGNRGLPPRYDYGYGEYGLRLTLTPD